MTNLDAAFIKAYGKTDGPTASSSVDTARAFREVDRLVDDRAPPARSAPSVEELCDGLGPRPASRPATSTITSPAWKEQLESQVIPAPHARFFAPPTVAAASPSLDVALPREPSPPLDADAGANPAAGAAPAATGSDTGDRVETAEAFRGAASAPKAPLSVFRSGESPREAALDASPADQPAAEPAADAQRRPSSPAASPGRDAATAQRAAAAAHSDATAVNSATAVGRVDATAGLSSSAGGARHRGTRLPEGEAPAERSGSAGASPSLHTITPGHLGTATRAAEHSSPASPLSTLRFDWKTPLAPRAPLEPAYQVDAFRWPAVCQELLARSPGDFDRLTEQLIAGLRAGRKTLAITPCAHGAGATTLALCLARRLSSHGLRVAIVDGDFAQPQLALRLDVLPPESWEEVLAGALPLAEALIESVADRVALLPLAKAVEAAGRISTTRLSRMVGQLRDHFEVVLIDTGADAATTAGPGSCWLTPAVVDGAVLVAHVVPVATAGPMSTTSSSSAESGVHRLAAARSQLDASGLAWWGIAENFVQG